MKPDRIFIGALLGALVTAAVLYSAPGKAQDLGGKALFQKNCAACHMATGKGIPGAFPALAGNAFVQGTPADVATVLLKGRGGMPDFSASLTDQDIAQVLTYVRSSWGNQAGAIGDADIAALREALNAARPGGGRLANKH